jgi:hypothetical protein
MEQSELTVGESAMLTRTIDDVLIRAFAEVTGNHKSDPPR